MFYVAVCLACASFIIGGGRMVLHLVGGTGTPIGLLVGLLALAVCLLGLLGGIDRKKYGIALIFSLVGFGFNYFLISMDTPNVIGYTMDYLRQALPFLFNLKG